MIHGPLGLEHFPTRRSSDLFALQNETHRGRGKTSIGIQKRNDRRHVRAADGDNHHHPENERYRDDYRSEEHTSELQSRGHLVCRLLLEKKKKNSTTCT